MFISTNLGQDLHPLLSDDKTIHYLLNGDISDGHEETGFVQNTRSNELCGKFPDYLGAVNIPGDKLMVFHGKGALSKISILDASTCSSFIFAEAACLNFQDSIKGIYREECGDKFVTFGNKNRLQSISLNCLPKTRIGDCQDCKDQYTDCLDCSALDINKHINFPCVELSETSGELECGVYQIGIRFQNEVFINPSLIRLFDKQSRTKGLNIDFKGCFTTYYNEFELILISNTESGLISYSQGMFNTSIKSYNITNTGEVIDDVEQRDSYYQGFQFIEENSESLILGNPCQRKQFDYRELAQQIKVEPILVAVKEKESHLYPSLMRDEVYAIDISFSYPDGQETSKFHIPSCPSKNSKWGLMTDYAQEGDNNCETGCETPRRRNFEIYNNGSIEINGDCKDCRETIVGTGEFSYWESQEKYPDNYPLLGCNPIKHFKMPKAPLSENGCVYVLALRITDIPNPVDCTGKELCLTPNIYISDRANNKSIDNKGLIFNMGIHEEECKDIYYPNFPFNDLNPNKYLKDKYETNIFSQGNLLDKFSKQYFTYYSPEHTYIDGGTGQYLQIYNEAIGKVQGKFHETKDYPKYQLLSGFGEVIAQLIGFVEGYLSATAQDCVTETETCVEKAEIITEVEYPVTAEGTTTLGAFTTGTSTQQADSTCNIEGITFEDNGDGGCDISATLSEDTPDGSAVTIILTETINGNTTPVPTTVTNNSINVTIDDECEIYNDLTAADFTVAGCCAGDKTTSTSTTECVDQFDIINNLGEKFPFLERLGDTFRLPLTIYYYMQGTLSAQNFLQSTIKPKNYAVQYTAEACFDEYKECKNEQRVIDLQQTLLPINQNIQDLCVHNWCGESSQLLCLNKEIDFPETEDCSRIVHSDLCGLDFGPLLTPFINFLPPIVQQFLNPFTNITEVNGVECNNSTGFGYNTTLNGKEIQSSGYYVGVKNYVPSQYGQLNHISRKVDSCNEIIYAGDVFITKHQITRKMPLWEKLPLGLPNNTEWDMRDYPNLAYPTYWMDYSNESLFQNILENTLDIFNFGIDHNLDTVECLGQCLNPFSVFINNVLGNLGGFVPAIGSILTTFFELFSANYVNPFRQSGIFYTHVTGILNYYAESEFIGNYRECTDESSYYPYKTLKELACSTEYHLPEQFPYNLKFNWKGYLKDAIRSEEFCCAKECNSLAYSTDDWTNFPPLNIQTFNTPITALAKIDDYNLFIGLEDEAFVTQLEETFTSEDGISFLVGSPDAFQRRLKKISTDSTGFGGIIDPDAVVMSRFGLIYPDRKRKRFLLYNGKLTDITGQMSSWFKEYMNGEIVGTWDNCSMNYYFTDKDTGWTFSYKPERKDSISWHSWIPEDYISSSNNFLTLKDDKLWRHNRKCHYQEFYGETHPFEVGFIIKDKQELNNLNIFTEWYECKGYDCKIYHRDKFFDEILIYNNCQTTNLQDIKLGNDKENPYNRENCKTANITAESKDCGEWSISGFRDMQTNQPFVCRKDNGWEYETGEDTISENYLSGKWFKVHLRSTEHNLKKIIMLNV